MRVLVPLLLVVAASATFHAAPTAGACHVWDMEPIEGAIVGGGGFYIAADYAGCPHEPTLCVIVWAPGAGAYLCPYP